MDFQRALVLFAWLAAMFAACTRVEVADPPPGVDIGQGGDNATSGGSGSGAGDGGDGAGSTPHPNAGSPGSIELGIWPTFAAAPDASSDTDAILAAVSALSAGSLTLPLYERWDDLSGATGLPRPLTWSRLDAVTRPYQDRSANIALCIGIVDREAPAWPFSGDPDSAPAIAAMERTIDEVYARYAQQLSHLCFGYELDRYLAKASAAQASQLLALLRHSIDYASGHARRSRRTGIGAAITLEALAGATDVNIDQLLLGDEVVAVYDPLDGDAQLKPPESVGDDLQRALETLQTQGDGETKPLVLFEVGYPSAGEIGSSEKAQRTHYGALFEALELHRDELAFVGLFGLGDRAALECEQEAASFGGSSAEAVRAVARCSMGLRAESEPKLAWPRVLSALSRYR